MDVSSEGDVHESQRLLSENNFMNISCLKI